MVTPFIFIKLAPVGASTRTINLLSLWFDIKIIYSLTNDTSISRFADDI